MLVLSLTLLYCALYAQKKKNSYIGQCSEVKVTSQKQGHQHEVPSITVQSMQNINHKQF